jgi:YegS/Rv2252/BmrU family lipid kinase
LNRRIKLIFNPIANLGRAWPIATALRPIVSELGGADWSGTVYPTHATELALKAAQDGYEMVVAMGGDGTVHEVINGLMQVPADQRPALGIVPLGSGNDLAATLGISNKPEIALRQIMTLPPLPMDVGLIVDEHGCREFWGNTLGIGFDAVINFRSHKVPLFQGFTVYFIALIQSILLNFTPYQIHALIDGQPLDEEILMFVVANGKREGGGFCMAPDADQSDGLFDYNYVERITRTRMLMTLPHYLNGTSAGQPCVHTGRLKKLELESNLPLFIHVDGETFSGFGSSTRKLSIEMIPSAIRVVRGESVSGS